MGENWLKVRFFWLFKANLSGFGEFGGVLLFRIWMLDLLFSDVCVAREMEEMSPSCVVSRRLVCERPCHMPNSWPPTRPAH